MLASVAELTPTDRIVIIEDTVELQCRAANSIALRATPSVDMQQFLRATIRLRPDRIIVGEVRGGCGIDVLFPIW
jgi:type IV secretion system protein TrbB